MSSEQTSELAKKLAERLEHEQPRLVVSRMTKALRPGKVLIDWSQNNSTKTTVAPYSLRARPRPTVSTPVSWDEVEACRQAPDLVFTAADVIARVQRAGDLFAATLPGWCCRPGAAGLSSRLLHPPLLAAFLSYLSVAGPLLVSP
jgi:bifunctional non-homologous end joining protein LigD